METKHTPGPWGVDSGMVQTFDETPIAHMDRTIGNGTTPVERDANARLIAAAPELLEALQYLADSYQKTRPNDCELVGEYVEARCAIAKATGR